VDWVVLNVAFFVDTASPRPPTTNVPMHYAVQCGTVTLEQNTIVFEYKNVLCSCSTIAYLLSLIEYS
jgi:hypothetical protein